MSKDGDFEEVGRAEDKSVMVEVVIGVLCDWCAPSQHSGVLCDWCAPSRLEGKFNKIVIGPMMTYGVECWLVKKHHMHKIIMVGMRMLR